MNTSRTPFRLHRYRTWISVAVIAVSLVQCGGTNDKKDAPASAVVKRVTIRDEITQVGSVEPVEKVDIKSEASGPVDKVYVKKGQRVSRGDTLIIIDPERLRYRKQRAYLELRRQRIRRDLAKRDLDNAKKLEPTGTVSRTRIDDAEAEYELARIEYEKQRLELKDITDQLDNTVVTAPIGGVLTALSVEQGEIVTSATSGFNAGTTIASIANTDELEVLCTVGEADYVYLDTGQTVYVSPQAYEDRRTRGTITFVSSFADRSSGSDLGSFEVRIGIDSVIAGIVPGINVTVSFVLKEKKDVVAVPYHFVHKRGERAVVYTVEKEKGGSVSARSVRLGITDYHYYEVLEGLSAGDSIVMAPHDTDGKDGPGKNKPRSGKSTGK
jgi:HlyD family secretion protein